MASAAPPRLHCTLAPRLPTCHPCSAAPAAAAARRRTSCWCGCSRRRRLVGRRGRRYPVASPPVAAAATALAAWQRGQLSCVPTGQGYRDSPPAPDALNGARSSGRDCHVRRYVSPLLRLPCVAEAEDACCGCWSRNRAWSALEGVGRRGMACAVRRLPPGRAGTAFPPFLAARRRYDLVAFGSTFSRGEQRGDDARLRRRAGVFAAGSGAAAVRRERSKRG
eukprot:357678-Chlamydomonas_euryale.AAC.8